MAQLRSSGPSGRPSGQGRLSIRHNLEKTPLQTGEVQPRVSLASQVRMGGLNLGLIALGLLIAVLVVVGIGVMIELSGGGLFQYWVDAMETQ